MPDESTPKGKKPVWPWVLVGCGVLGAGALVVAIVAAIAIPSLMVSRDYARGAGAVAAMRAYCSAQAMYRLNDWDGDGALKYATPYTVLNSQPDTNGQPAMLIDQAFAAASGPAGTPRLGYRFQDMQTIAGRKIDWVSDFALCAIPAPYAGPGSRSFVVSTAGTVYAKDLGRSAGFVADFPVDPAGAGWIANE